MHILMWSTISVYSITPFIWTLAIRIVH